MINVIIRKKGEIVTSIEVSGHALYDVSGKDIVCSAVSAVLIGGFNALADISDKMTFLVNNKISKVEIEDEDDHDLQITLKTIIVQLESIYESASDYIKINYC